MSPDKPASLGDRLSFGLEVGFSLAIVACGFAASWLYRQPDVRWVEWAVLLGLPVLASWGVVLLSGLSKDFYGRGRLEWPLYVTWPIAYLSLCVVIATLATTTSNGITAPFPQLAIVHFWLDPLRILLLGLGQALGLWLLGLKSSRAKPERPQSPPG